MNYEKGKSFMYAKSILDSLMASGKQLSDKAVSFAESSLGLPKPGQDRDAMLGTLGKAMMDEQLNRMDLADDAKKWLRLEMSANHDAKSIAASVDSPAAAAAQVYLVSSMIVDHASPVERAYLEQLREEMKLEQGLVDQIRVQLNP